MPHYTNRGRSFRAELFHHIEDPEERARLLLQEAHEILFEQSGFLRESAQNREHESVYIEIQDLGYALYQEVDHGLPDRSGLLRLSDFPEGLPKQWEWEDSWAMIYPTEEDK